MVEILRFALSALLGWRDLKVGRSSLKSNEAWLEALAKIVDRHRVVYDDWLPLDPGDLDDRLPG